MSHHEHHDHDHDHDHDHEAHDHEHDGSPQDTDFLDLELSKVLYSEAEQIVRTAFRELLKDAAKARLQERWGDRITALADLAVDQLIEDSEANLEIEARIAARNEGRRAAEQRLSEILGRSSGTQESGDTSDE